MLILHHAHSCTEWGTVEDTAVNQMDCWLFVPTQESSKCFQIMDNREQIESKMAVSAFTEL